MTAPRSLHPPGRSLLAGVLTCLVLSQLGLRLWVRHSPRPIPYGWAWLLENPWRRHYRDPRRLAAQCGLSSSDEVLEVGCGSGLFTAALAARCARLSALDIEPRYLAQTARKTAGLGNVTLLQGDLAALPCPDASLDVVVLISVLTELPHPVDALRECRRVLRPGGRVVIGEELFGPEYVRASTVERWAREAGLRPDSRQGNAWAYLQTYSSA